MKKVFSGFIIGMAVTGILMTIFWANISEKQNIRHTKQQFVSVFGFNPEDVDNALAQGLVNEEIKLHLEILCKREFFRLHNNTDNLLTKIAREQIYGMNNLAIRFKYQPNEKIQEVESNITKWDQGEKDFRKLKCY